MSLINSCSTPTTTLPSTWEQETLDLYTAYRESNNPISVSVAAQFDLLWKAIKAGGGSVSAPTEFTSEFSSEFL